MPSVGWPVSVASCLVGAGPNGVHELFRQVLLARVRCRFLDSLWPCVAFSAAVPTMYVVPTEARLYRQVMTYNHPGVFGEALPDASTGHAL